MSAAEEVTVTFKAVINKQNTTVLFAEVGHDFADLLLSFLIVPLGRIVQVLKKYYGDNMPVVGSLNTLYDGVVNLDSFHFQSDSRKLILLNPERDYASICHKYKLRFFDHQPTNDNSDEKAVPLGITDCTASFIISDDLRIVPNVKGSLLETLSCIGLTMADLDGAETRNVTFGVNELMDLLKGLLILHSPLTEIILCTRWASSNLEMDGVTDLNPNFVKKMTLKVMLQKSSNKLLFAQADEDFVDFLFGLLTIPFGAVKSLLRSSTHLNNIDNLYGSMVDHTDRLVVCDDIILKRALLGHCLLRSLNRGKTRFSVCFEKPFFVESAKSRMYMVRDDLTVTPLCVTSTLSLLSQMNISTCDVEEVEFQIGLFYLLCDQIMNLLKGSLLSITPLTDTILHKKSNADSAVMPEMLKEPKSHSTKMIIKALMNKETNEFICVLADKDFVDFLFSLLTIPLSRVVCLLGGKTCLNNINNLYKSVENLIDDKYFSRPDTKNRLMKPVLPPKYGTKNQIFSLSEQTTPSVYYLESKESKTKTIVEKGSWMYFKDPKGDEGSYVKPVGKFVVISDLTLIQSQDLIRIDLDQVLSGSKVVDLHIGLNESS